MLRFLNIPFSCLFLYGLLGSDYIMAEGGHMHHQQHGNHAGNSGKKGDGKDSSSTSGKTSSTNTTQWDGPTTKNTVTITLNENVKFIDDKITVTFYALKMSSAGTLTADMSRPVLTQEGKMGGRTLTIDKGKIPVMEVSAGTKWEDPDGPHAIDKAGDYFGCKIHIRGLEAIVYAPDIKNGKIEFFTVWDDLSETLLGRAKATK